MSTINSKDTFKSQQKIAFMEFILELPHLIAVSVLALLSGSLMLALDAFEALSCSMQTFLSFFLSKKLQGSDRFKYDYGMGKIEAFGSFASSAFLYIGLIIVFAVSVFSIINPHKPEEALFFAIILKIINVAVDIWLLYKQTTTVKGMKSSFIESNVILLKKNLIFDALTLFTITVSFIFQDVSLIVYLDPVVCIGCVIFIAFLNIKIIKEAASDLLDKTLDENTQMQIMACVSNIWGDINEFYGVRTRRSGHVTHIDLLVSFNDDSTYSEIYKAYKTFDQAIKEIIPHSSSAIVICDTANEEA